MPIVQVSVWQGFGEERARRLIQGITDSFVQVGVPAQAVEVVITEVPRSHWGSGGQVAAERPRPNEAGSQREERRPQGNRPARPSRGPRQEAPRGTDTRPGKRPRRGGSGQR